MPITDQYARLPLTSILVERDERQRREVETKGLVDSIRARGVLNPIIVERNLNGGPHRLTAGERRFAASMELGLPDIPVRFADELSPTEAQIFELEENIKRQELHWLDEARAILRIHQLYSELDPFWTQDRTANELGFTKGPISINIIVATKIDLLPQALQATSLREAYNMINRKMEREKAAEMDRLQEGMIHLDEEDNHQAPEIPPAFEALVPTPAIIHDIKAEANPAKNILLESFIHWAPKYVGPAFNFIHCDFPYGISVFDGPQSGGTRQHTYDDSREVHFKLLEVLLVHFDRLASSSCHVMYWFSMQHLDQIRRMVRELAPDLIIHVHPMVWHKTDNSGIASDPRRVPRHVYETALLLSRGNRPLIQPVADCYGAPTDNSLHIHTKPEPMLRHFFRMFVDEYTVFLDPTCGSGSSIRAAESLGARSTLGMDVDETTVGQARMALRHSRAKRSAALVI